MKTLAAISNIKQWYMIFSVSVHPDDGCMSFMNQPILKYSNEIRSAVLIVHGEKAHSYYFGKDAYENMIKNSKYTSNKELLTIPGAVHTDLYDNPDVIPFDKIQKFFKENGVG